MSLLPSVTLTIAVCVCCCCCCYCYGFVLLSSAPAAAGRTRYFEPGTGYAYDYESTLLLNEAEGPERGKDVGYHVTGKVRVEVIWQRPGTTHDKVLQLEVSTLLSLSYLSPIITCLLVM